MSFMNKFELKREEALNFMKFKVFFIYSKT
jgi:hypothetical protein